MGKFRDDAVRWGLKKLSYEQFTRFLNEYRALSAAVRRGGFTISPKTYRISAMVQRLVSVINSDVEYGRRFFIRIGLYSPQVRSVFESLSMMDKAWLEKNWRPFFRSLPDPRPWIIAFFSMLEQPRLSRRGELLLRYSGIWKSPKNAADDGVAEQILPPGVIGVHRPRLSWEHFRFLTPVDGLRQEQEQRDERRRNNNNNSGKNRDGKNQNAPAPVAAAPVVEVKNAPVEENCAAVEASAPPAEAPAQEATLTPMPSAVPGLLHLTSNSGVSQQQYEQVTAQRDALKEEVTALQQQLSQITGQRDELQQQVERGLAEMRGELQVAIDQLTQEKDEQVEQEVTAFKVMALHADNDSQEYLRQTVKYSEDLNKRTKEVLQKQRELDRVHHTRQQLRDELNRVEENLKAVNLAMDESMRLAPGIIELKKDLQKRSNELREKLREEVHREEGCSEAAARLEQFVKSQSNSDEGLLEMLDRVHEFTESRLGKLLLSHPGDQERLQQLVARKQTDCAIAQGAFSELITQRVNTKVTSNMLHITQLKKFEERFSEVEVYVDGYNVIKRDPYWAAQETTTNGFSVTRSEFVKLCERVAKNFRELTVVFDSDVVVDNIERRGNLTIVYVAKTNESQNADNYIVGKLAELAQKDQENGATAHRWLVSDDFKLRLRVSETCEASVLTPTFANYLRNGGNFQKRS